MKDRGSIEVTPQGVTIHDRRGEAHSFTWSSVDRILCYKVDLITTDDVCFENAIRSQCSNLKTWLRVMSTFGGYEAVDLTARKGRSA